MHGLEDTEGAYYSRYVYLLESLSTVRTCALVTDIQADDTMLDLFKVFFDVISEKHPKNVYMYALDIMHQIIEESDDISQPVVECTLEQLLLKHRKSPTAFRLAGDLLKLTSLRLQSYYGIVW